MRTFLSELRLYLINNLLCTIPSHVLRRWVYRRAMRFDLHSSTAIHLRCRFDAPGGLWIGQASVINRGCRIDTRGGVRIGSNVSISEEVVILTADHDVQSPDFRSRARMVSLADRVFVGTRATILPGCRLGEGSVLAAGALLTGDIPPYEIWAGVPARRIAERTRDLHYRTDYLRLFH